MPLTGDARAVQALARSLKALGTAGSPAERRLLAAVRKEFKPAVQVMYGSGVGPDGAWQPTVNGKQPFASRRMAGMIAVRRIPGGLSVDWRRAWMLAHDEGHTFPARRATSALRFYDQRGRFIGARGLTKRVLRLKFVEQRGGTSHTVGARVLPPRPQKPRGDLPAPWADAINRGATEGLREFAESAVK